MMMEAISILSRLTLAAVFLAAGVGKLLERGEGTEGTLEYQLLAHRSARLYGQALPWLELGTGFSMLLGLLLSLPPALKVVPLYMAMALLVAFTGAVAVALAQGRDVECHCFGRFGSGRVTGWTLARNLTLLALVAVASAGPRVQLAHLGDDIFSLATLPSLLLVFTILAIAAMTAEVAGLDGIARRARRDSSTRQES